MVDTHGHTKPNVIAHLSPKEYNLFVCVFSYKKYLALKLDACKLNKFLKMSFGQKSYSACSGQ